MTTIAGLFLIFLMGSLVVFVGVIIVSMFFGASSARCPKCRAANRSDARFCAICGHAIR